MTLNLISTTQARTMLPALIEEAKDHEVYILQNSERVAVLLSFEAYQHAMKIIEDLEDQLAVYQHSGEETEPFRPAGSQHKLIRA